MEKKILLVGRSKENLDALNKELQEIAAIEIFSGSDREEAIFLAKDNDFNLAIFDLQEGEDFAYQLGMELREEKRSFLLPLIFLSCESSNEIVFPQGFDVSSVDLFVKPYNREFLLGKVRSLLEFIDFHEEWQSTFDAIQDFICIIDLDNNILNANKFMMDVYGKDIIGKKCYKIVHCSDEPDEGCPVLSMLKENTAQHKTIQETIQSEQRFLDVSVFPIKDAAGNIYKYVHSIRDITEIKKLDNQLRQGEKMMAIGQLAGGIAHDFNNQLTAILGYSTLLKNKLEDDEVLSKFVEIIINATKRSADLTKQLLTFARKGIYKQSDHDVHKLISEAISIVDRTIDKKIKLELQLDATNSLVYCESSQLENAFLNLIINAKDAMPDGGTILISTKNLKLTSEDETIKKQLLPGNYIDIRVKDMGTGIPEDVLNRIFEPFFSTKNDKGTGLGLAAVYGAITGHKGTIEVVSEQGKGSEFIIKLPTTQKHSSIGEETLFALDDAKDTHKKSGVILLVDDEQMVREYTEEVVRTLGYDVISCSNGEEAIDIYRRKWQEIDLVLLDVIMPEMDGRETYEKMKECNPELEVVFISGFSSEKHLQGLLESDAVWLVKKPFEIKDLSDILKKIFA